MRETRGVRRAVHGACMVLGLFALATPPAHAQSAAVTTCGETLVTSGSYHLEADLGPCSGHGVVIAADDVHLTLAGHTITGVSSPTSCDLDNPQSGVVISAGTSRVKVSGGTLSGFVDGINLGGAQSRVTAMNVTGNCFFGMTVSGPDHRVDANVVTNNGTDGVALCESQDAVVTANYLAGNGRYAVIASCGPTTRKNQVVANVMQGNGLPTGDGGGVGIFFSEQDHIADNSITNNWDGIWLSWSQGATVTGNTVNGNRSGGISVSDLSHGNQVTGNTAWGNTTFDLSDASLACGTTTWAGNYFLTDSVAGVPDGGPGVGCIP
jgi:parallel beta-helix repeat protein